MSDIHELIVTVDLREGLSEQQLTELRWHLGLGPQPAHLTVVTDFPCVVVDDDGVPRIENEPRPLLAGSGPAWRTTGALCSALAARDGLPGGGWALTSRTEIHPDEAEEVGALLGWIAEHAQDTLRRGDGTVRLGHYRASEDPEPSALESRDGRINLAEALLPRSR
ncbi:hypothetical protein TK78_13660 [Streptomyces sp. Tue 6075]|uniref:hypothetical protein n=1 Tax=Streptomyces sp. Tue 6075 TaxID=1661694 RepID=UPI00094A60E5|nr:hypothetical protein [Streptomyces sp. Tue 6075]APS19894.1 hypothetical protein TK78_13660 [Streptomyces sp. Tue 6075]